MLNINKILIIAISLLFLLSVTGCTQDSTGGAGAIKKLDTSATTVSVNDDGTPPVIPTCSDPNTYLCGDVTLDGTINNADIEYIIDYVFSGGTAPTLMCAANVNGDEMVNVSDATYITNYLYQNGPAPNCVSVCQENWVCSDWSECTSGTQTRTCTDTSGCGTNNDKPESTKICQTVSDTPGDFEPANTNLDDSTPSYLPNCENPTSYVCGDVTLDAIVNVDDAEYLIDYVFNSGPAPILSCTANVNGDEQINVSDATYIVNYLYQNGPAPNCLQTCKENWECSDWTACVNGTQTRTCADSSSCGTLNTNPCIKRMCQASVLPVTEQEIRDTMLQTASSN